MPFVPELQTNISVAYAFEPMSIGDLTIRVGPGRTFGIDANVKF